MKPVSHKILFPSAAACVGGREGAGRGEEWVDRQRQQLTREKGGIKRCEEL